MATDIGDVDVPTLTVTPFDGTTVAVLTVTAPDGTETTPNATSSDDDPQVGTQTWTAEAVAYDQPGKWVLRWQVSGTGAGATETSLVVSRAMLGLPAITVDPTTDIGRVRLLATDLDEITPLFEDAQIQALLDMEAGRLRRAAAQALDTIASSEALVSKKIRTLDLSTDGPAVARELRERAKSLREQDDDIGDEGPWGIEIVNYDPWAAYRRTGV